MKLLSLKEIAALKEDEFGPKKGRAHILRCASCERLNEVTMQPVNGSISWQCAFCYRGTITKANVKR